MIISYVHLVSVAHTIAPSSSHLVFFLGMPVLPTAISVACGGKNCSWNSFKSSTCLQRTYRKEASEYQLQNKPPLQAQLEHLISHLAISILKCSNTCLSVSQENTGLTHDCERSNAHQSHLISTYIGNCSWENLKISGAV